MITVDDDADWENDVKAGWSDERQEGIVVSDADAIVDPRAVVVVALDADVTDGTVARAWGTDDLTIRAQVSWAEFLKELQEWQVLFRSQSSRIFSGGSDVTNEDTQSEHSLNDYLIKMLLI